MSHVASNCNCAICRVLRNALRKKLCKLFVAAPYLECYLRNGLWENSSLSWNILNHLLDVSVSSTILNIRMVEFFINVNAKFGG